MNSRTRNDPNCKTLAKKKIYTKGEQAHNNPPKKLKILMYVSERATEDQPIHIRSLYCRKMARSKNTMDCTQLHHRSIIMDRLAMAEEDTSQARKATSGVPMYSSTDRRRRLYRAGDERRRTSRPKSGRTVDDRGRQGTKTDEGETRKG